MLEGPSIELYKNLIKDNNNSLSLIASGGVSKFEDLIQLNEIGCEAAIVGSHENKISLKG